MKRSNKAFFLVFSLFFIASCGLNIQGRSLSNSSDKPVPVPCAGLIAVANQCVGPTPSPTPTGDQYLTAWDDFCKANADLANTVSDKAKELASANNAFALDMYGKLKDHDRNNLFVSPFSISMAFALANLGAASDTLTNLSHVLHFDKLAANDLDPAFKALLIATKCQKNAAYEITVANRLWGQQGFSFKSSYTDTSLADYAAPFQSLDFLRDNENSRHVINDWVAKMTNGKILDLIANLDPDTKMVLTNAIYFKAPWADKFIESQTKVEGFFRTSSEKVDVPFMHQGGHKLYFGNADMDVVSLPFMADKDAQGNVSGSRHTLVVVLPKAKDGLANIENALSVTTLGTVMSQLVSRDVNLHLPKFKFTYTPKLLKDDLRALGMNQAFDPTSADFSRMADPAEQRLFIASVVHKAFIDVNETGAEAAAATAIMMAGAAAPLPNPPPPIEFVADHPFLFMIVDTKTNAILFMGRVADPSK